MKALLTITVALNIAEFCFLVVLGFRIAHLEDLILGVKE